MRGEILWHPGFHHIQMVASLRVLSSLGRALSNERVSTISRWWLHCGRWSCRSREPPNTSFHHVQMVASWMGEAVGHKLQPRQGFHHLQMAASLMGERHSPRPVDGHGLLHLQVVGSLRVFTPSVTRRWTRVFPPSPDGGFIEGRVLCHCLRVELPEFPSSPDGGCIEGLGPRRRQPPADCRFHHLQMVASLRDDVSIDPAGVLKFEFPPSPDGGLIEGLMVHVHKSFWAVRFQHLEMVASFWGRAFPSLDADRPGSHGTRCPLRGCARTNPATHREPPHPAHAPSPVSLAAIPRGGSRPAVPPAGALPGSGPGHPNRPRRYSIAMPGMPVLVHPPAAPLTPS